MKNDCYMVKFATGRHYTVYASGKKEATILAQAEAIKAGEAWEHVIEIHTVD